jgi:hypothetical protein
MMMALLIAMQITSPASASELPFGAVEIVDPIAPAVHRYEDCLIQQLKAKGALPNINPAAYRPAVEAAISYCAPVRSQALLDADAALSKAPDYKDPERRNQAIKHAFDGTDFQRRFFVEILTSQLKKSEK